MPYKDKAKQCAFQRKWMKERRTAWIGEQGACVCGSTDRLSLVSKREMPGAQSHHIWSYSEGLRKKALKHFEIRCFKCAREVRGQRLSRRFLGRKGNWSILAPADVWAIRGRLLSKETMRSIARDFSIDHQVIQQIRLGKIHSSLARGKRSVFGITE